MKEKDKLESVRESTSRDQEYLFWTFKKHLVFEILLVIINKENKAYHWLFALRNTKIKFYVKLCALYFNKHFRKNESIYSPLNEEVLEYFIMQSTTNTHTKPTNMQTSKLVD